MSYAEVHKLPFETFNELWQSITIIEAEETLLKMSISAYPHMSENKQKEFHRKMHKQSRPKIFDSDENSKKPVPMDQFAKLLRAKG